MVHRLFSKTGILSRFLLRRDRIRLPIWLFSITAITIVVAQAFTGLYATSAEREGIAETMKNPAMKAMIGKGYGLDDYTIGAMMSHQMLLFTAITIGIMSILLVARHTRGDEEDGRIELIRSLPVGRLSNLLATFLVMVAANLLLMLLVGFGLYALQIESMDLGGSLLYGAVLGATGIFFAAITAVFAQLSENARGTIGYSFTVLGVAYLLRAIGDVGNETLSWFSPFGLLLATEAYVNNYWWPIIITLAISVVVMLLALYLYAIRDLESGFIRSKPGRERASIYLQSPLGLAIRLQRTTLISWVIGMFILGASYGSVLGDLESYFGDNEMMENLLTIVDGFTITDQFIAMLMSIMAMISAIPACLVVLKLKGEERKNRLEHILSRSVSRTRLMASTLVIAIVIGFLALSSSILGLWMAASQVMEDGLSFGTLYSAAMAYLPAIGIMVGIGLLFYGVAPRLTGITWMYLVYSFFVVYLGGLLQFPDWMERLSPFGNIPRIPIENFSLQKIAWTTAVAVFCMIIGWFGLKKRDIEG